MAEELGWEIEAFDEAFQEVSQLGMAKADFKARLVWLPKAISHNKPESPNVVRGWRAELDLLPECDLKREAIDAMREALVIAGPSYAEAFGELLPGASGKTVKPSSKPSPKAMPNQEQEQEQEQDRGEQAIAAQSPPPPSVEKQNKAKTLTAYLENCKVAKVKPIPDGHSLRIWAAEAGITTEMLQIAWVQFRERYTEAEKAKGKRYKDWPGHFATAVKNNWFKLWFAGDSGMQWSSVGLTHKTVLDARMAQKECDHA